MRFKSLAPLLFFIVSTIETPTSAAETPSTNVIPALKSVNISIEPLGFAFGTANVSAVFGVSDYIAIGPYFAYSSSSVSGLASVNVNTWGVGVGVDFFLNHSRFTDGMILTIGGNYANASANSSVSLGSSSYSSSVSASGIGLQAQFGYGWFWDFGLNITLQGGIQYSSATVIGYSISAVSPVIGFGVGWAF